MCGLEKAWCLANIVSHHDTDKGGFCGFPGRAVDYSQAERTALNNLVLEHQSMPILCFMNMAQSRSGFLHHKSTGMNSYLRFRFCTRTGKETSALTRTSAVTLNRKIPKPKSLHPRVQHGQPFVGRREVWAVKADSHGGESWGP